MKRILCVIPSLNAGGSERVMAILANEWIKDNEVTILTFNKGVPFYKVDERVKILGIGYMMPPGGMKRYLMMPGVEIKRYKAIKKEILQGDYDLVLSFTIVANIFCSLIAGRHPEQNIVISERGTPAIYSRTIRFINTMLYRRCRCVICQSEKTKSYYDVRGCSGKTIVLPNPVNFEDLPKVVPTQKEKAIVTTGRLVEIKNHKLIIEAFESIVKDYPDYILKIFGDGTLKEELTDMISQKHLEKKIFLLGEEKRVIQEVAKCSFFVLASDNEGFPNALLEAMGAFMPVISSDFDSGNARMLIKSDKNGYLFECGNAKQLADRMRCMLERSADFEAMGKENRKIAEQYDSKKVSVLWLNEIKVTQCN